jgi:Kef-type K+ transport system membrane component KefB
MHDMSNILFMLFAIIVTAKIFGSFAAKLGQSSVIGELCAGIVLGPSILGIITPDVTISNISEIGALILLFEVGVSTDIREFIKSGGWALIVAVIGVVCPYFLGYTCAKAFGLANLEAIFIGAVLTATSVGITARVFLDLKRLETEEAKIVLGAAVIDDVIGLIILAVVVKLISGIAVSAGSIISISLLAAGFLAGSVILGMLAAPKAFRFIKKVFGRESLIVLSFALCVLFSFFALKIGLAAIVGAFVAGLIVSASDEKKEVSESVKPLYGIFVPVFFVLMGTTVDVKAFNPFISSNLPVIMLALALFTAAFIGKVISGYAVLKKGVNKFLIGASMVPRGEVGLIFAAIGLKNGVLQQNIYSALVMVIMLTTLITPIILKAVLNKENKK